MNSVMEIKISERKCLLNRDEGLLLGEGFNQLSGFGTGVDFSSVQITNEYELLNHLPMEIKKSKKADLENKRALFFQLGLIITLGCVFVAFEWSTTDVKVGDQYQVDEEVVEEEVPPITRQEEIAPPPPPPPPQVSDVLEIVEDDVELDEELEVEDTDMDDDLEVDFSKLLDEEDDESDAPIPFFILENKPEYPGGEKEMFKFLYSKVRYPAVCQENGVQGMVSLSFVINKKGEVTNIKVLRGPDPNLEREAVRVVEQMPKWKPGKQRGRPVAVTYNLPMRFRLQ